MPKSTKPSTASAPRPRASPGRRSEQEITMIKGLHHNAYRCGDSEETRRFYEDFLGLPLAHTLKIEETMTGRKTGAGVLHTFYRLHHRSVRPVFGAPRMPIEVKDQHHLDLPIAPQSER